MINHHTIFQI